MLKRLLICTLLLVFFYDRGYCAELFAKYRGKNVWVVNDSDGRIDFLRTIDGATFTVVGENIIADSKIIDAEVAKQELQTKEGTSEVQFGEVVKQLNQIKIGLDYYKKKISKPGSNLEQAMQESWDFATSSGVSMGLKREYYKRLVESASRSEKEYNSFVSMIPVNLDDAIVKSRNGWKKEALQKATLAKVTENISLDENDANVLASGKLNNDPSYRHIQTTETLLDLKKGYILRRDTVDRLLKEDAFETPEFKDELVSWWKVEKEKYLKDFPQWGEGTLATYRNTDMERFNREKLTPGSLQDRQINDCQLFLNKVVSVYLNEESEKASAKGNNFLSLDEFEVNHWREIEEGLNRFRANLDVYKEILTSYTAATKADPGINSEEFYKSIPDDVKNDAALLRFDMWKRQLARWPTIESVDSYIATFPHTPSEGFKVYGQKYAMANFAKYWATEELKKLEPGLGISRVAVEKHLAEWNSGNPKISPAIRDRYEDIIYNEVRLRMIFNRELGNIEFKDEAFKKELLAYWEKYKKNSTKGMEDVLSWDEIK